jgi:large subunit ribosomal protein L24
MAAKIRKGDRVEVISGAHKGKRGEVTRVSPKDDRAVVQGVAMATHHTKPAGMGKPGGIERREAAVHLSNLALLDPKTDKPVRVGFRVLEDGRKVRVSRATGNLFES